MSQRRAIFLTGFMATGKSRIGRLLATRMGRAFIDTDDMIEERAGKTIAEIFATEGEEHFRTLERDCVTEAARQDAVVALGGGAIAQDETWETIQKTQGVLVCIEADVETILTRVSRRETRPLLAGLNQQEKRDKISRMLAERAPYYNRAHITVQSTEESEPEDAVNAVLAALEARGAC